jgi:hypothetical protein
MFIAGHDVFASGSETGSIKLDIAAMSNTAKYEYQTGVFSLLVFVPILCAGLQLFAWSQFTLHTKRLQWIKSIRSGSLKYASV